MLAVRVIPCLDVDAGRVVKGVNFRELRDAGDPVEMARLYDAEGADELVFLDITASSDRRDTMVDVVARTAELVFIPFTVGGGIRSADDVRRMLRAGADKCSLNTSAVDDPDLVGAGAEQPVHVVGAPHPAADRERDEHLLSGATHDVVRRRAVPAGCGDVEEHQLVGTLGVIDPRHLDGVPGVAQVDEVDALDDTPRIDVEARDDPDRNGHNPTPGL